MSDFETLIGDVVPAPPFLHEQVTMNAMLFAGNRDALDGYVQSVFGRVPGAWARVEHHAVMLVTLYAGSVRPMDERYDSRDGVPEVDCGFWVMVRCGRDGDAGRLYWAPVCLFVDSVFALIVGREVYGFPKLLGRIDPPAPGGDVAVAVHTDHFVRDGDRSRLARDALLFSVTRDGDPAGRTTPIGPAGLYDAVAAAFATALPSADLPFFTMPMLFLKQFRDIRNAPAAAYARITSLDIAPRGGRFDLRLIDSDGLRLTFQPSDGLYLPRHLGIANHAPALVAFRITMDFIAGEGQVVAG